MLNALKYKCYILGFLRKNSPQFKKPIHNARYQVKKEL